MTMQGETRNLRNCLVFDRRQLRDKPWLTGLDRAIRENPDCERGVMARQGWAYSENGPGSDGSRPELLVWITHGLRDEPAECHWYGHVIYRQGEDGSGRWLSTLVRTEIRPDGLTGDAVLNHWKALINEEHRYCFGYAQDPEDTCLYRNAFEKAVSGLEMQIRRFRRILREEKIVEWWDTGIPGTRHPIAEKPTEDSMEDLSNMSIYGLGDALCHEFLKEGG
ncbi:MAG: hypothetical protein F4X92_05265 [Gammaproteobacteria bacterium]|nr:hypothetical protein [Gammaproteobacteria bacterium]